MLIVLLCGMYIRAQGDAPKLIISEIYMNHVEEAYLELTNVDDHPVDLSRVILSVAGNDLYYREDTSRWDTQMLTHAGYLEPGESFVVMNYRTLTTDPTDIWTPSWYLGMADYWLWYTARGSSSGLRFTNGNDAFGLWWDDGDRAVNFSQDSLIEEIGYPESDVPFDVAGVTNASMTHVFIRKANVTVGNGGDWAKSAGVSAEDSEWIAIPYDAWRLGALFTTVGRHGTGYEWDFTPVIGTVDDIGMTIPWGTWRDSAYKAFDIGPNMGWHLVWGADTLQSNVIQTGDTLVVYLCGDDVESRRYPLTVTEAVESNNIIIPRLNLAQTSTPYGITQGMPVIDTIYEIPYNTRIDTLFAYLEKASNATWEYVTFDGTQRAEVRTGDKVVVTAANNDVKEYIIRTEEYDPSDNAFLETILIDNDTLWGFDRNITTYTLIMPEDATSFPSIAATPVSNDARVSITQPKFIRGTEEERTATITVVAESDTIVNNYRLIFDFARPIQPNELEAFFSQVIIGSNMNESGFEIFNPSNVPISLADYMMVRARPDGGAPIASLEDAITNRDSSDRDYILNFGYYFDNSRADEGVFYKEATNYNIDIEPYGVWFIKRENNDEWGGPDNADFYCLKDDQPLFYDSNDGSNTGYVYLGYNYWLLKMENDSILNGLKSADDPDDWRFVDIWGTVGDRFDHTLTVDGYLMEWDFERHMIRKGHIYKGNPEPYGSIREPNGPGSSEWNIVTGDDFEGPLSDVLQHSGFIKPTYFISTVKSGVYLVSVGISDNESIDGIFPGSTVEAFLANLIKADPGQVLEVRAGNGSGVLAATDAVATGDTLVVQSQDQTNTTRYILETGFLSNNALLSSSVYDISVTGLKGTVGTVEHLTTIGELLADITVPNGAFLNIYDNQRRHVPLMNIAPDTLIEIDPVVNDSIFLEVIAQDGVTKIEYSIVMASLDEPYITSNSYLIDQENRIIDLFIDNTNIRTFLSRVTPSSGAHINVYDKFDFERTQSDMYIDDKVVVTDGNNVSVVYTLKGFYDRTVEDTTNNDTTSNHVVREVLEGQHTLYPNPANNLLRINGLEVGSKIVIMNLYGEAMEIRESYNDIAEIDLHAYPSGIYFVRVLHGTKSYSYSFIRK